MWENKIVQTKPHLCKGDGDIMKYRRWYNQFYSKNSMTYQNYKDKFLDW
jgi:hypothetical protein